VWGRYDLLLLPPSFPYGGMENPCLTFVTPTLLAGDRSLTNVVAHEVRGGLSVLCEQVCVPEQLCDQLFNINRQMQTAPGLHATVTAATATVLAGDRSLTSVVAHKVEDSFVRCTTHLCERWWTQNSCVVCCSWKGSNAASRSLEQRLACQLFKGDFPQTAYPPHPFRLLVLCISITSAQIAHSWSGNLVTNASWEHFWLNEGWTVFLERKIVGRLQVGWGVVG
jgi:hypothetical protein